jgi:hypothetical protein
MPRPGWLPVQGPGKLFSANDLAAVRAMVCSEENDQPKESTSKPKWNKGAFYKKMKKVKGRRAVEDLPCLSDEVKKLANGSKEEDINSLESFEKESIAN